MAKKVRRVQQNPSRTSKTRVSTSSDEGGTADSAETADAARTTGATRVEGRSARPSRRVSKAQLHEEYAHVQRDLRLIFIVAAAMFVLLIALNLIAPQIL